MPFVLRYDTDRVPPILRNHLKTIGWTEYDEELPAEEQPPWNLWWKSARFTVSQLQGALYPKQRLNHFPKSSEITKKDTLLRNLRRMKGVHGPVCDILPASFILPGEYVKFCQAFATARDSGRDAIWICKPSELSRGRKIFLFKDIGYLSYDCPSVVQSYVERPLLLSGYKFDLRVYVLVTSFQPLRVYIYRNFLVRFGTEKYNISDLTNLCSHLTNTSLNKFAPGCDTNKEGIGEGCKWDAEQFINWLEPHGLPMSLLWQRIETVVNVTLLSICNAVPTHTPCFELYGFDFLIDCQFKPWLLEVNFSPALQIDGPADERIKGPLVADMIATLNIKDSSEEDSPVSSQGKSHVRSPGSTKKSNLAGQTKSSRNRVVREVQKNREKSRFLDSAKGDFDMCFPFNGETEAASESLAACPATERDMAMRVIFAEIKKKEIPAHHRCRALSKKIFSEQHDSSTLSISPAPVPVVQKPNALSSIEAKLPLLPLATPPNMHRPLFQKKKILADRKRPSAVRGVK